MIQILVLLSLVIFPKSLFAAEEFSVNQNIDYYLKDTGTASITQNFFITNLYSQIYLKEYEISLDEPGISQITGHDSNGNIIKSINKDNDITKIHLQFHTPKIGKNQTTNFTLNYLVDKLAIHKGKTWELELPQFNLTKNEQINLKINLPASYGELSFSTLNNPQIQILNDRQIVSLSLNQDTAKNKILLIFGNHQLFTFTLKYYLSNPNSYPITTEIAIPPDTNTQKITFEDFSPRPDSIKNDPDGNWLAQYTLKANQKINIKVRGYAKIFSLNKSPTIIDLSRYLEAKEFWPSDSPIIANTIQNLKSIRDIYNFTVNYLSYNFENISSASRQGALTALKNPSSALCTEFSDLFVTLARANKIPAREIEGFAYTNNPKIKPLNSNSDILHSWPQYYDSALQNWISVDPTWEKTTNGVDYFSDLDLNHLVFVIHGIDSIYPPPPGSYRNPQNEKTVDVEFANNFPKINYSPLTISINNHQLTISNPNLSSINNLKITTSNYNFSLAQLPPLGQVSYKIKTTPFIPVNIKYQSDEISDVFSTKVIIKPTTSLIFIGGSITFLCLLGIIITSIHNHEKSS